MSRKRKEPIEALGPAVNGLEFPASLSAPEPDLPEPDLEDELDQAGALDQPGEPEEAWEPCALIIGDGEAALATGRVAGQCGFAVEYATAAGGAEAAEFPVGAPRRLDNFDNLVDDCGIGRRHFVCVFIKDAAAAVDILSQCLDSDAHYIGLDAKGAEKEGIFNALKEEGAPDAELAAIAAPMGLNIGADTPERRAVAIVAEMLAARAGKLKRLRH